MAQPTISTKRRLIVMLLVISLVVFLLITRLGYIQIVQGEDLKKQALEQWTRGIPVQAKRGIIYDREGKKLAISISKDTVWCRPADVKDPKTTAQKVASILGLEEDEVYDKITSKQSVIKIKQWIEKEESEALHKENLSGIEIANDNKRFYPYGSFLSFVLGHTNIDQAGQYGVERTYDKYLTGIPGKWVKTTDAVGRQLPYGEEKLYEAQDGLSVVLTIDEVIQHFAEKAALEAYVENKAKRVSILIMEPKTGDMLAMATMPDYDPNTPNVPVDDNKKKEWENLPQEQLLKNWYDMWRNFPINDTYEPGSTFKIITAAAGLEENIVTPSTQFYCDGFITDIPGARLKCWRWYNPHGSETFVQGVQNSCNEVFVAVGRNLGNEKMYKYIKGFGFGDKTGIDLTGEQAGLIPSSPDAMREVNLATISYGQGIAVTPIQLITAISAVANGGDLMQPRIVKELIDLEGNVVEKIEPEVKRKVISEETSKTLLAILESVVSTGTGKNAYIPGYRVGGKTGTAQKVIDGRYAEGKYISSFAAVAPADDPKIAILVIIDEPSNGAYYGGMIAAPVAGEVINETLRYLEVEPQFTEAEKKEYEEKSITVPDVRGMIINEAGKSLKALGLSYNTDTYFEIDESSKVVDQFPLPGTKVSKNSLIDLYVQSKRVEDNTVIVPDLTGSTREEATEVLNVLNLTFNFNGDGIVVNQNPKAGTKVDYNSLIEVELQHISE